MKLKILKILAVSNKLGLGDTPTKQTPFTTAIDWENWGVTEAAQLNSIETPTESFYDEAWYNEWQKSYNEWQQNSIQPVQTTAYSLINLHELEMEIKTTVATIQKVKNQKPTSFDDLLATT